MKRNLSLHRQFADHDDQLQQQSRLLYRCLPLSYLYKKNGGIFLGVNNQLQIPRQCDLYASVCAPVGYIDFNKTLGDILNGVARKKRYRQREK